MKLKIQTLATASLISAALAVSAPVKAADLGGSCCADLEERVAELEATTARKGNRKVSLKVSGWVNKLLLFWDDGEDSDAYVTDSGNSSSRFRFTGSGKISSDLSAGFKVEIEFDTAESSSVNQLDDDGDSTNGALDLRNAEWWIKSKQLGKLTMGQGSTATDNLILLELGGTGVISSPTFSVGRGFFLRDSATGALANRKWTDVVSGTGGLFDTTRRDHIRYDTPSIAGFVLSAAWGEDDFWDVALSYKGKSKDFVYAARVGYLEDRDETNTQVNTFLSVASAWHRPSGLFLTLNYAHKTFDGTNRDHLKDRDFFRALGGIRQRWSSLGDTSIYGEYVDANDAAEGLGVEAGGVDLGTITGSETNIYGIGIVQRIDAAAMELYASYRHWETDLEGVDFDAGDFDTVAVGARIKF